MNGWLEKIMPEIGIEIEIYCSCGAGLCRQSSVGKTKGRGQPYFTVEPCEGCLKKEKESDYDEGYKHAEKDYKEDQR
ncbi:MAG: hypothetical protein DDT19_01043 [Syntrophomonadaceae bacterium]|nr:hypothetical protein [Bacillota bacterium]